MLVWLGLKFVSYVSLVVVRLRGWGGSVSLLWIRPLELQKNRVCG